MNTKSLQKIAVFHPIFLCIGLFIFLLSPSFLQAQREIILPKVIEIPFSLENNFIVVKITFNRSFPLRFIFDTGAEHTILTKKEIAQIAGIPFERQYKIIGSDMRQELYAYLIRRIHLKVGNVDLPNQSMLVLEDDYFRFEEYSGVHVHGILGADIFRSFYIKIDYERKKIKLMRKQFAAKQLEAYTVIPLEIFKNKAYVNLHAQLDADTLTPVKLLLDTGAALPLLIYPNSNINMSLPDQVVPGNVGMGLGGYLEGYMGRIKQLKVPNSDLVLHNVLTNFQVIDSLMETSQMNERNGLLGNETLRRFDVIIDYPNGQLFLRPNKYFDQKFQFDKSGLSIVANGIFLNEYIIHNILPNSPAAEAGLQVGDEILAVNGLAASAITLLGITNKMKRKEGKKIRLKVKRGEEKIKVIFYLRKLV